MTLSGTTLYGTAAYGGAHSGGTLFQIGTDGSGFTVLQRFFADGAFPQAPLLPLSQSGATTLFGTCLKGGDGLGLVFGMDTAGAFTLSSTAVSGASLCAGLTSDGSATSAATLYGVSEYDSSGAVGGTVFSLPATGGAVGAASLTPATHGAYAVAGLTRIGAEITILQTQRAIYYGVRGVGAGLGAAPRAETCGGPGGNHHPGV